MNTHQKFQLTHSVVTPLVKQAFASFKYAFYYLYPNIFEIDVDPNGLVFLKAVPFTRKLFPWLLSVTFITGICGGGSCLYICTTRIFGVTRMPWIQWNLFIIALGLLFAVTLEIFCCLILYNSPTVFQAFSEIIRLEQKCNLNYTQIF